MKKFLISLFIVTTGILSYSCEDDFCSDTTTPNLIIDFLDNDNRDSIKEIELIVWANTTGDTIYNDTYSASGDLELPLDTQNESVTYHFSKQSEDDTETGSTEDIIINYTTEDIFVSKDCGFKSVFNNLTISATNNDWLLDSETTTNSITNETEVHVKVYH